MTLSDWPNVQRMWSNKPSIPGISWITGFETIPSHWHARFRIANEALNRFTWRYEDLRQITSEAQLRNYISNNTTGAKIDEGSLKCLIQVFFEFKF